MAKVIKTVEDLNKAIDSCTENLDKKFAGKNGKRSITICGGTGCLSSNSGEILARFEQLIKEKGCFPGLTVLPSERNISILFINISISRETSRFQCYPPDRQSFEF